jgi:hypothetical protein
MAKLAREYVMFVMGDELPWRWETLVESYLNEKTTLSVKSLEYIETRLSYNQISFKEFCEYIKARKSGKHINYSEKMIKYIDNHSKKVVGDDITITIEYESTKKPIVGITNDNSSGYICRCAIEWDAMQRIFSWDLKKYKSLRDKLIDVISKQGDSDSVTIEDLKKIE